ncbi:hypothetical protein KC337_g87 [Hortaea werneckii]|nr:hypothetical protein KC337_g87 [Hortaea werneckii]
MSPKTPIYLGRGHANENNSERDEDPTASLHNQKQTQKRDDKDVYVWCPPSLDRLTHFAETKEWLYTTRGLSELRGQHEERVGDVEPLKDYS